MQVIANGIVAGAGYALFALGFGLVHSTGRFFHMAHGGSYVVGAYLTYVLVSKVGLSSLVGGCGGVLGGAVLGAMMEIAVFRPLRRRNASREGMFLAALGLMVCIQNGVSLVFGDQPVVLRTASVEPGMLFLGARITNVQVCIVATCIAAAASAWIGLQKTNLGMRIRAVASSHELATVYGLRPEAILLLVMVCASALGSLAGILSGFDTDLTPSMGFYAQLMGVAASIVGGIGSVRGSLLGGFMVGLVQHLGVWKLPTQWQEAIVFALVAVCLCIRARGFLRTNWGTKD